MYSEQSSNSAFGRRLLGLCVYVVFGLSILFGMCLSTGTGIFNTYHIAEDGDRTGMVSWTWMMTLLPSLLYGILKILVWRAKGGWGVGGGGL